MKLEGLSAGEITTLVIGLLLAAAGIISTLGGAAEKVAKIVRALKAPNAAQDKRLEALEKHSEAVDQFLATDKRRLDDIEKSNRITQRALLGLLEHGIDGNSIKRMQDSREEIENHLINR